MPASGAYRRDFEGISRLYRPFFRRFRRDFKGLNRLSEGFQGSGWVSRDLKGFQVQGISESFHKHLEAFQGVSGGFMRFCRSFPTSEARFKEISEGF